MASSEVDQKLLGRFAKDVEHENPLLASILFKILGLSINLSRYLTTAKKQLQRQPHLLQTDEYRDLCNHILWLAREGSRLLEQYVLPMVGNAVELKILAFKLRASFYHIFVIYRNNPPVWYLIPTPSSKPPQASASVEESLSLASSSSSHRVVNKGKAVAKDEHDFLPSSGSDSPPLDPHTEALKSTYAPPPEMLRPPPGFTSDAPPGSFLLPSINYLPIAYQYFREAIALAEQLLWGSHSLRLSVKTEFAAFLYECLHDAEASRKFASDTITEVYDATESIDNDMFTDACELVTVLGHMKKRGLGPKQSPHPRGSVPAQNSYATPQALALAPHPPIPGAGGAPPDMI